MQTGCENFPNGNMLGTQLQPGDTESRRESISTDTTQAITLSVIACTRDWPTCLKIVSCESRLTSNMRHGTPSSGGMNAGLWQNTFKFQLTNITRVTNHEQHDLSCHSKANNFRTASIELVCAVCTTTLPLLRCLWLGSCPCSCPAQACPSRMCPHNDGSFQMVGVVERMWLVRVVVRVWLERV